MRFGFGERMNLRTVLAGQPEHWSRAREHFSEFNLPVCDILGFRLETQVSQVSRYFRDLCDLYLDLDLSDARSLSKEVFLV